MPLERVFSLFDDSSKLAIEAPVAQALRTGRAVKSGKDSVLQKHDSGRYSVQYSISPLLNRDNNALGVVIVLHDVTENRSMARQLSYQSTHDALTGLLT